MDERDMYIFNESYKRNISLLYLESPAAKLSFMMLYASVAIM